MKCTKCHTEIPLDSHYCLNCGQQIIRENLISHYVAKISQEDINSEYVEKSRKLFCIAFFGFDLLLSTVISLFSLPNIWVFILSLIMYIVSIVFGILGIKKSLYLKHENNKANGLVTSLCLILMSIFIIYINVSSMINVL